MRLELGGAKAESASIIHKVLILRRLAEKELGDFRGL
jgi:hypothetical protein